MEGTKTAFPVESIQPQKQEKTGLEERMRPLAVSTNVEDFDKSGKPFLKAYRGASKLENKVALITGGDSGIGRSTALLYAIEGADVSIVHLPSEKEDVETLKEQFESIGRRFLPIEADLLCESTWKQVIERHMFEFGQLDILVNNAARQHIYESIEELDLENAKKTFKLNNIAMLALIKYASPHLKRGARIILTTSVASYQGNPNLVDYSATKGGIHTMTRALAKQFGPRCIRVNCVAPGIIYTPLQPSTGNQPAEKQEALGKDRVPLERAGQPIEVATANVFLASSDSSYFTGTCLEPDGGQAMAS